LVPLAYVARVEDVLDLYAKEAGPMRPVICFDESRSRRRQASLVVTIADICATARPFVDARKSWRHVKVMDHRTARDFADCMRDLVDVHYPGADRIRV